MGTRALSAEPGPARGGVFRDLTGRRFGRLTAVRPTGEKAADGCYYWLCRCACGEETVVSSSKLLQGKTVSCGCYGRERRAESRTYVGGTCLEIVRSPRTPKNNTSGVKGVSRSRGMWLAKISFARRQFFLGRYREFEKAVAVHRRAVALRAEVLEQIDALGDGAVAVLAQRLEELRRSV